MSPVDRIYAICKERNIPISRLERACDFSNGYIRRLQKGYMPSDRLQKVADYLQVTVSYLINGAEETNGYYLDPQSAAIAQQMFEDPEMRLLFDAKREMSPKKFSKIIDIITAFREMENAEDDGDI